MSTPTSLMTSSSVAGVPDPADAAAGEVVYSSDGLAPVEVTKPSVTTIASNESLDNADDVVLDSEQMPAELAFEVFQGKIYSNGGGSRNGTTATTAAIMKQQLLFAQQEDGGDNSYVEMSPLEKLALLQQQVSDLEAELKTTAADSGRAFDEQIVQIAGDLKSRLAVASSAQTTDQDELSRMIRQQLEQVQQDKMSKKQPTFTTTTTEAGTAGDTGLVYELYGTSSSNPTTSMEERVLKLERVLGNAQQGSAVTSGGSSGGGGASKSLMQRLEEMESLVATVDATVMEQTATKAKVIRADLEAASKARSKLSAAYKKEDTKMIQQLYQQMVDLEGVSDYLPSLVDRLSQLSVLHRQASTFGGRLDELEKTAQQLEATVGQIEGDMEGLQSAMIGNIQTLEQNMAKLDERLNALK